MDNTNFPINDRKFPSKSYRVAKRGDKIPPVETKRSVPNFQILVGYQFTGDVWI